CCRKLPRGDYQALSLEEMAAHPEADIVIIATPGRSGLGPTLAAVEAGKRIALANKESLVVGGDLVRQAVRAGEAELLPVDSEHSAIAQCLVGHRRQEVAGLILTASGGPFRTTPRADLARVSRAEVLNHPTWNMGPKITVDSATLMNKGLEVIEAHHLFGLPYSAIEVVVHPGSHVHSLVTLCDGAVLAQLGSPDMRVPLLYAISGEKRWPLAAQRLDLVATGALHFEAPDLERFPCLRLAREAGEAGGSAPIVLNAANEVAVEAFLEKRIRFLDIPDVIERTLGKSAFMKAPSLDEIFETDLEARQVANDLI
ncbi:MAG: 1-deoxy-D-xylulose-5-phosphate reductoisomerase, partial [Dehalococcoidales bacterium]|nr:1-deoxy-D-xylulose-5-phosphate reductoisomerase [Dehalococcoidales bacterium]